MNADNPMIRPRLSAMMFLQFFVWSAWYMPLSAYMNGVLHFSGTQVGWIYTTTAIGALVSPMFVGFVADRYFATERILAALHLVGGICLLLASQATGFGWLMLLLVLNALGFMPTLALANSLSFRNIDDPDRFSRIAVFGTIGWIIASWLVDFALGGPSTGRFFYLAGCGGLAMAAYSLTLPHTPPKGAEAASADVFGLRALSLLKETPFLVFAVCVFLISIPLSLYFAWGTGFLDEMGRRNPTFLMSLGQFSEIAVMMVMPWFIGRIGLKNVLVVGMAAWAIRYVLFATMSFPLILLGLLLHGFCYCFVFVASFIYVSKRAPAEMSASAQSLVALLMWGAGMFIGAKFGGDMADWYPPAVTIAATKGETTSPGQILPPWATTKMVEGVETQVGIAPAIGRPEANDVTIERAQKNLPEEGVTIGGFSYAKADLVAALEKADTDESGAVTRTEWQAARSHNWPPIWIWPGLLAAVVCLVFVAGGSDVPRPEEAAAPAADAL